MNRVKLICFKRIVIGFATSCLGVVVTTWALKTYVPNSTPYLFAGGAAFATLYCMSLAMRAAIREAYRAGEVGRRLPTRRVRGAIEAQRDRSGMRRPARTVFSADVDRGSADEAPAVAVVDDD